MPRGGTCPQFNDTHTLVADVFFRREEERKKLLVAGEFDLTAPIRVGLRYETAC